MKKILLSTIVIAGLLLTTCGNEPYEEFYSGTPEDDEAIIALLDANQEYRSVDDLFSSTYIPLTMGAVTFPVEDSFFRVDSPLVKVLLDSIADTLTSMDYLRDLWYAKDTTCTVYFYDTFSCIALSHVAVEYEAHYDVPVIDTVTRETLAWRIGTVDIDSTGYFDEEAFMGEGLRVIFFEPERDSSAPPETLETGEVRYPIKDPRVWQLSKILYGNYGFPDRGADRPAISNVILSANAGEQVDTIWSSNTDASYTGHAMNRFREIGALIEYEDSTAVQVTISISGDIVADDCTFYASCGKNRIQLPSGVGTLMVTGSGVTNLCFDVVTEESYYYKNPDKGYAASSWLVPVSITSD
jgi:hypothetical protein